MFSRNRAKMFTNWWKVKSFWNFCHATRVKVRISRVISSKKFYANWFMAQKSILGWKSWKFSSKSTREILGKTFASQKVLKNSKSFSRSRFPFQIISARTYVYVAFKCSTIMSIAVPLCHAVIVKRSSVDFMWFQMFTSCVM